MYDNVDFEMLLTETSKPRVTLIPAARIPERMLEDARRDRFLGPDVVHADRSMTGIMYGEKLVGFLTPRVNDGDWWRTGAIYVDKFGRRYRARTTFIIKQASFTERFFLPNGMQVDKSTCLEKIK